MSLAALEFEIPRRVVLFKKNTRMPGGTTQLGITGDPNVLDPVRVLDYTTGEFLLANSPPMTMYLDMDSDELWRRTTAETWVRFGEGEGGGGWLEYTESLKGTDILEGELYSHPYYKTLIALNDHVGKYPLDIFDGNWKSLTTDQTFTHQGTDAERLLRLVPTLVSTKPIENVPIASGQAPWVSEIPQRFILELHDSLYLYAIKYQNSPEPTKRVKAVKIYSASEYPSESIASTARMTLLHSGDLQTSRTIPVERVKTKYIVVDCLSNYGHPTQLALESLEVLAYVGDFLTSNTAYTNFKTIDPIWGDNGNGQGIVTSREAGTCDGSVGDTEWAFASEDALNTLHEPDGLALTDDEGELLLFNTFVHEDGKGDYAFAELGGLKTLHIENGNALTDEEGNLLLFENTPDVEEPVVLSMLQVHYLGVVESADRVTIKIKTNYTAKIYLSIPSLSIDSRDLGYDTSVTTDVGALTAGETYQFTIRVSKHGFDTLYESSSFTTRAKNVTAIPLILKSLRSTTQDYGSDISAKWATPANWLLKAGTRSWQGEGTSLEVNHSFRPSDEASEVSLQVTSGARSGHTLTQLALGKNEALPPVSLEILEPEAISGESLPRVITDPYDPEVGNTLKFYITIYQIEIQVNRPGVLKVHARPLTASGPETVVWSGDLVEGVNTIDFDLTSPSTLYQVLFVFVPNSDILDVIREERFFATKHTHKFAYQTTTGVVNATYVYEGKTVIENLGDASDEILVIVSEDRTEDLKIFLMEAGEGGKGPATLRLGTRAGEVITEVAAPMVTTYGNTVTASVNSAAGSVFDWVFGSW